MKPFEMTSWFAGTVRDDRRMIEAVRDDRGVIEAVRDDKALCCDEELLSGVSPCWRTSNKFEKPQRKRNPNRATMSFRTVGRNLKK